MNERTINVAVIFAGGCGKRMNSKDEIPKQFLEVCGKPIIIHTIDIFQQAEDVDFVIVVCIESWISYMEELIYKFRLDKIESVVRGGKTGQESIYNGLKEADRIHGRENVIVLIHDGVRPLISKELISKNIASVEKYRSAITTSEAKETFVLIDEMESVVAIPGRAQSRIAKAPQSFYLKDILEVHEKALKDHIFNAIDSCTLMNMYHRELAIVEGSYENIKITTPDDFYMFRALYSARENEQIEKNE